MTSTLLRLSTALAVSMAFASTAHAAEASAARTSYERQRSACLAGKSTEDRATCLKEAGAAYELAKQGKLTNGDADFRKDELARCNVFHDAADRRDCVARMTGGGTVSGSVAGGGVIREHVTKEIVRPAEIVPAAPAASAAR